MHEHSAFITLTYNDQHLPKNQSISVREIQLFIKKLRKHVEPIKLRFYACGEYGEKTHRPHYHALIFGYGFPDKKLYKTVTATEQDYYTSDTLQNIWQQGHCIIGDITHQSAAYCARYVTKKINGDPWQTHYTMLCPETGELIPIREEFATMSRRPGIGNSFYKKYRGDIFPDDFCIIDGKKRKTPGYYLALLREEEPKLYELMKTKRYESMLANAQDNTNSRLEAREECATSSANQLIRTLQ